MINIEKKYEIIYGDPPWHYRDKANAGKRGASHKYLVVGDVHIKELPVGDIADKDCMLFLWITMPKLPVAFEVIKAWGFEYKTCAFTWVKKYKNGNNFFGMGRWTRSNAELCLLATRGKPKRIDAGVSQIIESVPGRHSEKPKEARDLIVRLIGDKNRIELFAREKVSGWDCWVNEV